MSHRERVRAALSHQEPDRVPMDLGSTQVTTLTLRAYRALRAACGLSPRRPLMLSTVFQVVRLDEELLQYLDIDFRPLFYRPMRRRPSAGNADTFIDGWGITWRRPRGGLYFELAESPLAEAGVDDLESYAWPDPLNPDRLAGLREVARRLHKGTDYALVGPGMEGGFFEDAWMLRGLERFLTDLLLDPPFVHALLRRIVDIRKQMFGCYLDLVGEYLDVVYVADDLAIQNGPLLSHALYRAIVKPYQQELYAFIKERCDAKLLYHCCGSVGSLIDDFIEIGVDIINPVQVSAEGMRADWLKQRYGDRICFWGGIDTQRVLPYGTAREVRREVDRLVRELAPGGGFVLGPVHNVQPDVPPENLLAAYDEARIVGRYPLTS